MILEKERYIMWSIKTKDRRGKVYCFNETSNSETITSYTHTHGKKKPFHAKGGCQLVKSTIFLFLSLLEHWYLCWLCLGSLTQKMVEADKSPTGIPFKFVSYLITR